MRKPEIGLPLLKGKIVDNKFGPFLATNLLDNFLSKNLQNLKLINSQEICLIIYFSLIFYFYSKMSSKIFIPAFLLLILSEMVPAPSSGIILNGFDELRERVATETKIENERRANSEAALSRVNSDLGMEKTVRGAHRRRASTSAIYVDFDQQPTRPNPTKNYATFDEIRSGSLPFPHFAPTNPAPRLTSADRRKIIKASKPTTLARKESKFGRKLSAIISPLKLKSISWRSLSNLLGPNRNRTNGRKRLLS